MLQNCTVASARVNWPEIATSLVCRATSSAGGTMRLQPGRFAGNSDTPVHNTSDFSVRSQGLAWKRTDTHARRLTHACTRSAADSACHVASSSARCDRRGPELCVQHTGAHRTCPAPTVARERSGRPGPRVSPTPQPTATAAPPCVPARHATAPGSPGLGSGPHSRLSAVAARAASPCYPHVAALVSARWACTSAVWPTPNDLATACDSAARHLGGGRR